MIRKKSREHFYEERSEKIFTKDFVDKGHGICIQDTKTTNKTNKRNLINFVKEVSSTS